MYIVGGSAVSQPQLRSSWAACSRECGGGEHARSRVVARVARSGGAACPEALVMNLIILVGLVFMQELLFVKNVKITG